MSSSKREPQVEEWTPEEHEADVRPEPTIKVRTSGRSNHRLHDLTKETK